jgi:hypothetical protein
VEVPAGAGKTPASVATTQIEALEVRPRGCHAWVAPPLKLEGKHEANTSVGGGSEARGGAGAASGGDGGELRRGERPVVQGRGRGPSAGGPGRDEGRRQMGREEGERER